MKNKKKKLKIAIFHCGFIYTGGGERIVLEEIEGLRKLGHKVDCFVPTYDPALSYPDIIRKYEIKTFLPQLPKFIPLRFAVQMVVSCLVAPFLAYRFSQYDIFLGANQPGAYMAWVISRLLKKPYFVYLSQPNRVLYPRDNEDWQNVKDYYYLNKIINKLFFGPVEFLDTKSITGGKTLFINGSFVAKEIVRIYKPVSWTDCPGGANVPIKSTLDINRSRGQIKVNGHTPQKPYVLFTSRHEPWKRFDWAIEVMAKVIKSYSDVRLVIPGAETAITPELKKLAKSLSIEDRVIFTGAITQNSLWKLYKNAYLYIFTSEKEDLGIVVQEAQANGAPVVAWKSGGPTVTVIDKKTGYLISPYNQTKMADRIIYLLKNPKMRDELGRSAWQHIKKNFSWKRHVNILESEFLKAV
jgi:glycosyltransferase involved in cell wall biosynthesis